MFDELVAVADHARGAAGVGAWARVENAACARRLAAAADVLERLLSEAGSLDREQWCIDNWTMAAAEVAAAQGVSLGVASHQLSIAYDLRYRIPRVAAVFAAGTISSRMIAAVTTRIRLVRDAAAMAKIDADLAAHLGGWTTLSVDRLHNAIDSAVDRYDPAAVRRTETRARGRYVDIHAPSDGSGTASIEGALLATDAEALDQRLDAMAAAVCDGDPRTGEQRRSDALGALGHGADRLACACGQHDCAAAAPSPSAVVVHVLAHQESLSDDTAAQLDGQDPPPPTLAQCVNRQPSTQEPAGPAATDPGFLMSKAMLPAPLLAAKIAGTARIEYIHHPGDSPPEPRYIASAVLAWFVRCRDLTCRFPGCDEPASRCDLDHTIAYPAGPTQASNLKCLCRTHHLLKTFGRWRDVQHPDGTLDWLSPSGQKYTTDPGAKLLFPTLCRPTAPTVIDHSIEPLHDAVRSLKMPRRKHTRADNRAKAIADERRHNQTYAAERNKPPPRPQP